MLIGERQIASPERVMETCRCESILMVAKGGTMRAILLALLWPLALLPLAAQAQDPAAEALEGAWVVSVGDQPRDRFLIVKGAKAEKNEVRVESAVFGFLDLKGRPVTDWRAEVLGDAIKLSFVTGSDSVVHVSFKASETSASGEMTTKGGKKLFVRMTRLDADELAAMRAAAAETKGQQAKGPAVAKNAKITLVYVGADNCGSCRRFIARVGEDGKRLGEIAPELTEARFVYVFLWNYRDPVGEKQLPPDLAWLSQPAPTGKPWLRKYGTPYFAAVVDQRVIAQGHGTVALETLVAPAIKRAVEQRRAAH
jgi:hypothetical protein